MHDPKELAEKWLETPGAKSAMETALRLEVTAVGSEVRATARQFCKIFLRGWLEEQYPEESPVFLAGVVFPKAWDITVGGRTRQ